METLIKSQTYEWAAALPLECSLIHASHHPRKTPVWVLICFRVESARIVRLFGPNSSMAAPLRLGIKVLLVEVSIA